MPKRKHNDRGDGDAHPPKSVVDARQLGHFRATIDQSHKTLVSALKLARGFERQKMGRRQKNDFNNPKGLLRRREEVIVLKQLDLDKTARNHIVKSLMKSKRARESPLFIIVYGAEPKLDPVSTVEGVVLGRLCNSNPVKLAMPRIMVSALEALGVDDVSTSATQKKEKKHTSASIRPELDPMEITDDEDESAPEEDINVSDELSHPDILASSEEESSDEDLDQENSQAAESSKPKRRPKSRPLSPPPLSGRTAFIPSLSMGGYYSGSESSDEEGGQIRDSALPKERKNRRGQRARQQIAELKHGKNAKHLQNQKKSRDAGWDRRKGAVSTTNHGKVNKGFGKPQNIDGAVRPSKPKTRDDTGPIHPSWEAAKQRKLQSAAPPAFAGKKITFD